MFDPWRLRTLRELALRGTMSAVADALSLTPSAVSQQLAALEREVGVQLVEPDGRRVRLTVAGQALAARAEGILGAMLAAADEVSALERDVAGPIRLAAFPTAAANLCPEVMRSLAERYPRHYITLVELEPHESFAAFMRGDLDLAIVDGHGLPEDGRDTGLVHEELFVEPLYCVMARDHWAARRQRVNLRDLAEERWVMGDLSAPFYRLIADACYAEGFQPILAASTRSFEVVISLVRSGFGISILPWLGLVGEDGLAIRPVQPRLSRAVHAAYRRGSSARPSIAAALALFRAAAAAMSQDEPTARRAGQATIGARSSPVSTTGRVPS
jgi:DNA-binding transcriptional LysR family regulator